jgi:hypothetical protein
VKAIPNNREGFRQTINAGDTLSEEGAELRAFVFPTAHSSPELDQLLVLAPTLDGYGEYT